MCYGHARFVAGTDSCNRSITLPNVLLLFHTAVEPKNAAYSTEPPLDRSIKRM